MHQSLLKKHWLPAGNYSLVYMIFKGQILLYNCFFKRNAKPRQTSKAAARSFSDRNAAKQLFTYLLFQLFHKLFKAFVAFEHLAEFVVGLRDDIIYGIKIRFGVHFEDFNLIIVHLA